MIQNLRFFLWPDSTFKTDWRSFMLSIHSVCFYKNNRNDVGQSSVIHQEDEANGTKTKLCWSGIKAMTDLTFWSSTGNS